MEKISGLMIQANNLDYLSVAKSWGPRVRSRLTKRGTRRRPNSNYSMDCEGAYNAIPLKPFSISVVSGCPERTFTLNEPSRPHLFPFCRSRRISASSFRPETDVHIAILWPFWEKLATVLQQVEGLHLIILHWEGFWFPDESVSIRKTNASW